MTRDKSFRLITRAARGGRGGKTAVELVLVGLQTDLRTRREKIRISFSIPKQSVPKYSYSKIKVDEVAVYFLCPIS